jgi:myo-inositol-1(or 4)-monophosphatase
MTEAGLARRAAFARELAREAGTLALRYFRREIAYTTEAKALQDFVSAADREVEALIRREIVRAFPGDAMMGEELGGAPGDEMWFVDPIDGTINFVHGVRYWCVSIAFTVAGSRRIGVVYDPSADELFWAVKGEGAWCGSERITVSDCADFEDALIVAGYVHRHPLAHSLELRRALLSAGAAVKDMGAGALMLAHVAAGRYDGFIEPHMHPWDALAGLLLVEEAGGRALPYPGSAPLAGGGRVIATAPDLFQPLVALDDKASRT